MAFATQALSNIPHPNLLPYRDVQSSSPSSPPVPNHRLASSKQKFASDLSQCLCDFVVQLLPTQEELVVREDVRKLLERLIRTIEPHSRLLSFGSNANGFSLRIQVLISLSTAHFPNEYTSRYGPMLLNRL